MLRLLSFCKAEHTTALQKVAFPFFRPLHSSSCCRSAKSNIPLRFRKSCFHFSGRCTLRLLSFCKIAHTIAFQKVVFPSFWSLHASPHLMAHGSSLVGHINAGSFLTVHTYPHMLGATASPENPNSNQFPNISCFTVEFGRPRRAPPRAGRLAASGHCPFRGGDMRDDAELNIRCS